MTEFLFRGRQAVQLENEHLRISVLKQGGHIAEIFDKKAQVSPLWIPPWDSVEPSTFRPSEASAFGSGADARLLAGIMGHNLCLDIFGGPSLEEAEAGITVHGEASVLTYAIEQSTTQLVMKLVLPLAQLRFSRTLELIGRYLRVREIVENLMSFDRPIAWTQHVTLGPPFLDPATTQFAASVGRSYVSETDPGLNAYLRPGQEFAWPYAPNINGGVSDLRKMYGNSPASGYTAHLANLNFDKAFFVAFSPEYRLAFGYIWKRADFPWLGIWEENRSRRASPWNGMTITRGMEFGVSPIPETRQEMVDRNKLFDTPTYRWLPAKEKLEAEYWISTESTDAMPELLTWPEV